MYDNCSYRPDSKRIIVALSFSPEKKSVFIFIDLKASVLEIVLIYKGKDIVFIMHLGIFMQQLSAPSMVKGTEKVEAGNESRSI